MNIERFVDDLKNDSDVVELDLYEYYDGLTVNLKRSNTNEETYRVYYEGHIDNDILDDMQKIWFNNIKNMKNLKKLKINSRFADELDIKNMVVPKNLEFLQIPSDNTLNSDTIIELLKNGCIVVIDYNDLFTDDFTQFNNADEFINYIELLEIKKNEYMEYYKCA